MLKKGIGAILPLDPDLASGIEVDFDEPLRDEMIGVSRSEEGPPIGGPFIFQDPSDQR